MKNLLLFFSHVLNLILVFVIAFGLGTILGYVDPDKCVSSGVNDVLQKFNKRKENKDKPKNVVQMGFHLED